jgi:hypothetical protein
MIVLALLLVAQDCGYSDYRCGNDSYSSYEDQVEDSDEYTNYRRYYKRRNHQHVRPRLRWAPPRHENGQRRHRYGGLKDWH